MTDAMSKCTTDAIVDALRRTPHLARIGRREYGSLVNPRRPVAAMATTVRIFAPDVSINIAHMPPNVQREIRSWIGKAPTYHMVDSIADYIESVFVMPMPILALAAMHPSTTYTECLQRVSVLVTSHQNALHTVYTFIDAISHAQFIYVHVARHAALINDIIHRCQIKTAVVANIRAGHIMPATYIISYDTPPRGVSPKPGESYAVYKTRVCDAFLASAHIKICTPFDSVVLLLLASASFDTLAQTTASLIEFPMQI